MAPRRGATCLPLALALAAGALGPAPARAQCPQLELGPAYALSGDCGPGAATGASCFISCDGANGYLGSAAPSASTCQASGTWSATSAVGCALAECGAYARTGYATSCTSTSYGGVCTIACDSGSGYVGTPWASSATCRIDQTWSVAPGALSGCVLASCGAPPSAPPGYAVSCAGTTFGDACAIGCGTGYVGVPSSASMACTLSGWSPDPSGLGGCAPVDCGSLSVPHASAADCTAHSRYGETCAVGCDAGYSGSPGASCTAAGTWSVTGSCEPIACYAAPATNGESCGGSGETCLSGSCASPAAGQLCSGPLDLEPGVAQTFAVSDLHDLLSVEQCASTAVAGRDLFVRASVSAGEYRIAVEGGLGAVQAFDLDGCTGTRCDPVALSAAALGRGAALRFASDGEVLVAVHLLDPQDATTIAVSLERVPAAAGPAPGTSSGGCATGGGRAPMLALLAWTILFGRGRRRRAPGRAP